MAEEAPKKNKRPTSLKRDIQNEKKRQINKQFKSKVKTTLTKFQKAVQEKVSGDEQKSKLSAVYSMLDKGVKKGIFKKNKASRLKSSCLKKIS